MEGSSGGEGEGHTISLSGRELGGRFCTKVNRNFVIFLCFAGNKALLLRLSINLLKNNANKLQR